jgi:hypothetical protein
VALNALEERIKGLVLSAGRNASTGQLCQEGLDFLVTGHPRVHRGKSFEIAAKSEHVSIFSRESFVLSSQRLAQPLNCLGRIHCFWNQFSAVTWTNTVHIRFFLMGREREPLAGKSVK